MLKTVSVEEGSLSVTVNELSRFMVQDALILTLKPRVYQCCVSMRGRSICLHGFDTWTILSADASIHGSETWTIL